MKFIQFFLLVAMLCLTSYLSLATIRIVNNSTPTPVGTYATIQLAHDAASPGDTLMLTPSESEYSGINVTRKLHIIGNGWDRASTLLPNTKTGTFSFSGGSSGSSLTGCLINGQINVYTDDITIKRNKCGFIYSDGNLNTIIIQNIILGSRTSSNRDAGSMVYISANSSGVITNNIIINTTSSGVYSRWGLIICYPSQCVISNNIFKGQSGATIFDTSGNSYIGQSFYNNIIIEGGVSGVIGSHHNLCNSTQLPATDGNQQNIDINSLFVDLANNDFHLKSGSPAIGAGYNGSDCGIYGGELGFVDKGVPGLPYIYYLDVPGVANKKDGLNVTVKAKSGN
jgi:hypothetical protein